MMRDDEAGKRQEVKRYLPAGWKRMKAGQRETHHQLPHGCIRKKNFNEQMFLFRNGPSRDAT